jgi:hypothetical protein
VDSQHIPGRFLHRHSGIGIARARTPRLNRPVDQTFNLDGLQMHAVQTAPNGVINRDTLFRFAQERDAVWTSYAGGRIIRGFLVGVVDGARLTFHYCQSKTGGALNSGHSNREPGRTADGLVEILEHFQWASGAGTGLNIIRQIPA